MATARSTPQQNPKASASRTVSRPWLSLYPLSRIVLISPLW